MDIQSVVEGNKDITESALSALAERSFFITRSTAVMTIDGVVCTVGSKTLLCNDPSAHFDQLYRGISDKHCCLNYGIRDSLKRRDVRYVIVFHQDYQAAVFEDMFVAHVPLERYHSAQRFDNIIYMADLGHMLRYDVPKLNGPRYSQEYFSLNFSRVDYPLFDMSDCICVYFRVYEKCSQEELAEMIKKFEEKVYKPTEKYLIVSDSCFIKERLASAHSNCFIIKMPVDFRADSGNQDDWAIPVRNKKSLDLALTEVFYAKQCKEIYVSYGKFGLMIAAYAGKEPKKFV